MAHVPPARHLLRARDLADARYFEAVGLQSIGSFTTSFSRAFGKSPTAYRASFPPPSAYARIPSCFLRAYGRPRNRTFREDKDAVRA